MNKLIKIILFLFVFSSSIFGSTYIIDDIYDGNVYLGNEIRDNLISRVSSSDRVWLSEGGKWKLERFRNRGDEFINFSTKRTRIHKTVLSAYIDLFPEKLAVDNKIAIEFNKDNPDESDALLQEYNGTSFILVFLYPLNDFSAKNIPQIVNSWLNSEDNKDECPNKSAPAFKIEEVDLNGKKIELFYLFISCNDQKPEGFFSYYKEENTEDITAFFEVINTEEKGTTLSLKITDEAIRDLIIRGPANNFHTNDAFCDLKYVGNFKEKKEELVTFKINNAHFDCSCKKMAGNDFYGTYLLKNDLSSLFEEKIPDDPDQFIVSDENEEKVYRLRKICEGFPIDDRPKFMKMTTENRDPKSNLFIATFGKGFDLRVDISQVRDNLPKNISDNQRPKIDSETINKWNDFYWYRYWFVWLNCAWIFLVICTTICFKKKRPLAITIRSAFWIVAPAIFLFLMYKWTESYQASTYFWMSIAFFILYIFELISCFFITPQYILFQSGIIEDFGWRWWGYFPNPINFNNRSVPGSYSVFAQETPFKFINTNFADLCKINEKLCETICIKIDEKDRKYLRRKSVSEKCSNVFSPGIYILNLNEIETAFWKKILDDDKQSRVVFIKTIPEKTRIEEFILNEINHAENNIKDVNYINRIMAVNAKCFFGSIKTLVNAEDIATETAIYNAINCGSLGGRKYNDLLFEFDKYNGYPFRRLIKEKILDYLNNIDGGLERYNTYSNLIAYFNSLGGTYITIEDFFYKEKKDLFKKIQNTNEIENIPIKGPGFQREKITFVEQISTILEDKHV